MTAAPTDAFAGGFADPVFDSQAVFRALLAAMAEPASPVACAPRASAPRPMPPLMASLAQCLVDADTPVWLDAALAAAPEVGRWIAFHTGAPVTAEPSEAAFALAVDGARLPPLSAFSRGTADYPDRSTTVVVAVDGFDLAGASRFDGPGFEAPRSFAPSPAPPRLMSEIDANRALFPCGVDLVFLAADAIAALPRSARRITE